MLEFSSTVLPAPSPYLIMINLGIYNYLHLYNTNKSVLFLFQIIYTHLAHSYHIDDQDPTEYTNCSKLL